MRILAYEFRGGTKNDLHFSKMNFGKLNLIVGDSATGKTRLLNTIFNGATLVTHKDRFYIGYWDMTLEHGSKNYRWTINTGKDHADEEAKVIKEKLYLFDGDKQTLLINRTTESFIFNDKELPKLSPRKSAISLLEVEDLIKPLYKALSSIMRRNFSGSDLDHESSYQSIPQNFLKRIKRTKDLKELFSSNLNLNCKLYILSEIFTDIYKRITDEFIAIFPFVSEVKILQADKFGVNFPGIVPVFSLKEKFHKEWIPLDQLSSGMKKVLLILSDVFTLPEEGCVYLVDEYENSLGIGAINFFPTVLFEAENKNQFIITSHHPYIIGNVPVKDWIILHRKGNEVLVKQGNELEERFSKSKQQAFIQLINDPFYTEGVE
jgi:AAA15 family ATPase/GTPase